LASGAFSAAALAGAAGLAAGFAGAAASGWAGVVWASVTPALGLEAGLVADLEGAVWVSAGCAVTLGVTALPAAILVAASWEAAAFAAGCLVVVFVVTIGIDFRSLVVAGVARLAFGLVVSVLAADVFVATALAVATLVVGADADDFGLARDTVAPAAGMARRAFVEDSVDFFIRSASHQQRCVTATQPGAMANAPGLQAPGALAWPPITLLTMICGARPRWLKSVQGVRQRM
jgi:hypothetical protein